MRRGYLLATLALVAGCYPDPYVPPEEDAGEDAGAPSVCVPECRAGQVCLGFRCVAAIDAGSDAGGRLDLGVDTGPSCCPIDPPSCGCVFIGGSTRAGLCARVCGEGDPSLWVRSRDAFGCERWTSSGTRCADAGFDAGGAAADDGG